MKHRILIEFSADTLPDDFLDQIAGRVYGHPAVDKKECTAAFVGDVLKDAERWAFAINPNASPASGISDWPLIIRASDEEVVWGDEANKLCDAAKDAQ